MEAEKIKAILLATACFLMACLNLWNLFKDWFDEKYQPRKRNGDKGEPDPAKEKEPIPDIMGKSKPVFRQTPEIQPDEAKLRLENEILELKRKLEEKEKNEPFPAVDIKAEEPPDDDPVDYEEEESLPVMTERERSPFDTGTTLDEFELLVKTLKGKPVTKDEETRVGRIIPKVEGTDIYNLFTKQIQGAEERAAAIMAGMGDAGKSPSAGEPGGFDYGKYIRE